jgi:hypothetical protein
MLLNKIEIRRLARANQMHRIMVNFKSLHIFKGIFETQKSTRNGKNNAKIRALGTWGPRVYHRPIYHDGALRDANGPLMNPASRSSDRL